MARTFNFQRLMLNVLVIGVLFSYGFVALMAQDCSADILQTAYQKKQVNGWQYNAGYK